MKCKSCVAALLALFMLGVTTSCEDMFNIESNRVVLNHEINSTADSVYSTLGVLQCMRKVADRYVILGEVRGDMAQIDDEKTKTSLRNLANFNFEDDNEYLNVRDYYAIINNCNYALAKMDTFLTISSQRVMVDEYAALQGIRAWTYLQLAINYGAIPYYTDPVTSEEPLEALAQNKKDVQFIATDLARELLPLLDHELPSFASTTGAYPILRLVLAELYLWSGDYANAKKYYEEYFMKNKKATLTMSDVDGSVMQAGYVDLGGKFTNWDGVDLKDGVSSNNLNYTVNGAVKYGDSGAENLSQIPMETSSDKGVVSEVARLFTTAELRPSAYWKSLSSKQTIFNVQENDKNEKSIKSSVKIGDMRRYEYLSTGFTFNLNADGLEEQEAYDMYTKHVNNKIVTQRRSIACLRWAEAMNALAKEQFVVGADSLTNAEARQNAVNAFYLLKDAFKVFFPEGSKVWTNFERFHDQLQTKYVGIHARGAGDVYYDTLHYVLTPNAIISRLGLTDSIVTFSDTIQYIDELLIDELALESTLEGNRFGDLIRFAKRREAWGDGEYRDFLASRVANRGGEEEEEAVRDSLYRKLNDSEEYWYLPFK